MTIILNFMRIFLEKIECRNKFGRNYKFIFLEINTDDKITYGKLKNILRQEYSKKSREELEEERDKYKYNKIILELYIPAV